MNPQELYAIVGQLVAGADFVKGSRFVQGGGTSDMELHRKMGNWGLMKVAQVLFGGRYSDLCYGYFAFWRSHLRVLAPDVDGFEIETLLNVRALKCKLQVAEVPSFEARRIHGVSNLRTIPDGWRVLMKIMRLSFTSALARSKRNLSRAKLQRGDDAGPKDVPDLTA